jgi:ParB-like chromosome segregation protein Spo0J
MTKRNGQFMPKLVKLRTARLTPLPNSPAMRTSRKSLQALLKSIRDCGILRPLVVMTRCLEGKFVIVDGHRCHEVAKLLGIKQVPVLLYEGTDRLSARELRQHISGDRPSREKCN